MISGCPNKIDWSVIPVEDGVKLITDSGSCTFIDDYEYRRVVTAFADKIERYYKSCTPKQLSDDEFERSGYIAFWNEWH